MWSAANLSCRGVFQFSEEKPSWFDNHTRILLNLIILRETITKYYLEEHFGIDVEMKVIELEFQILCI